MVHTNHPVVEPAISVAHNVVEDYELFELFAEVLLDFFGPDEAARAGGGGIGPSAIVGFDVHFFVVEGVSGGGAADGSVPIYVAAAVCAGAVEGKGGGLGVGPGVVAEEDVGVYRVSV